MVSAHVLRQRIKAAGFRSVVGRDSGGRLTNFYRLSDVKKACADLLGAVPKAKHDGTLKLNGEQWGTVRALKKVLTQKR
jgi:hypothetical protein